jgi:hypothetical protein
MAGAFKYIQIASDVRPIGVGLRDTFTYVIVSDLSKFWYRSSMHI